MNGETHLPSLLLHAAPQLAPDEFVFLCVPDETAARALSPLGLFHEAEGVTAICTVAHARAAGHTFDATFRQITFTVHSSLEAVGFLAAITALLARHGLACNAVSAFHHDHVFVPARDAGRAMRALASLTASVEH